MKFLKTLSKNIFDLIIVPILLTLSLLLVLAIVVIVINLPVIIFQLFSIDSSFWISVIYFEWIALLLSIMCSLAFYSYDFSLKGVLLSTFIMFIIFSLISGYIALCIHFHLLLWITLSLIVIGVLTGIVIKSYKETKM